MTIVFKALALLPLLAWVAILSFICWTLSWVPGDPTV